MASPRHLDHAPITEAIIDFRVKLPKDFEVEQLATLKDKLRDRYPKVEEHRLVRGIFELKAGRPASRSADLGLRGFLFRSGDLLSVAQFTIDGFTFSRLRPYTSWEDIFPEARKLWSLYVETASPEFITRVAARYINHLNVPSPTKDFSQYLNAPPTIPPDLPKDMNSFLTRIVIHEPKLKVAANITQALEPGKEPGQIVIILDIDVYKKQEFEINDQTLWSTFADLRNLKNQIFFSSITEETARLFE